MAVTCGPRARSTGEQRSTLRFQTCTHSFQPRRNNHEWQDHPAGRGQSGRRRADTAGAQEEQHRQRGRRRGRWCGGPGIPDGHRQVCETCHRRPARGRPAGPEAAKGRWARGPARHAGGPADTDAARGHPDLIHRGARHHRQLPTGSQQLHPQALGLRPIRGSHTETGPVLAGAEPGPAGQSLMSPDPMTPVLRIIIIEDNPDDALLVTREVEHAGYAVQAQRVQTAEELRAALTQGTWDLVLADYSLPHFSATEGLAILKKTGLDVPFIIVSGCIGEEAAVQLMKDGTADYVMKDHLSRLGPTVHLELREADERRRKHAAERSLAESEERYRLLVESQTDLIIKTDPKGRFLYASPTYCALFGKSLQELTTSSYQPKIHPDDVSAVAGATAGLFHPPYSCRYEARAMTVDGWRWIEWNARAELDSQDTIVALLGSGRDITDRKQAEEEIQRERTFFDQLVETAPEGIAITNTQGRVMRVNAEFVRMFGYGVDEVVGQYLDDLVAPPALQEEARAITMSTSQGGGTLLETVRRRKDGTLVDVSLIGASILVAGKQEALFAIYRDITERKQAEAQLRQSQKMEAIGTLAGGVAHDFNNLLTGILGNIALMRSSLPPADPLLENLDAAETAARQAADLTKGLLAFSRRAMVLPVPMSLTAALDATLVLLKQSLPATMEIIRDYELTAWNVLVDQSQITQIMLNLAVNARDAMKGKGTLAIRTRNVTVDTNYVHKHSYARTGEFVHLSVTDTGPGMSSEVMQHLFEPFHTTKPTGSGTGLGLSIVYGAVKQADGWITAVSTEGVGRTVPQKHPSEAPLRSTPQIGRTSSGGLEEHPRGHWTNMFGGDLRHLPPSMPGGTHPVRHSQSPLCERRQRNGPGGRRRANRVCGRSGVPQQERIYGPDSAGRSIGLERPTGSLGRHWAHPAGHDHAGHDHRRSRTGHPGPGPHSPHPAELRIYLQRHRQAHARRGDRAGIPAQTLRAA